MRSDDHIWPNFAVFLNNRGLVDKRVLALLGVNLVVIEVSCLPEEVIFGLANVEPEVVFECQAIQLAFAGHRRKNLLLYHAKFLRDAGQHRNIKQVDPRVDLIANEMCGLFDKRFDLPIRIRHNHSESARIRYLCQHNRAFLLVSPMKLQQLFQREIANDITIEYEKHAFLVIRLQYALSQLQRASCAQGISFLRVRQLDFVFGLERLQGSFDIVSLVVYGKHNFDHSDTC